MSDCLRPSALKHATLPCPSLSPRVCSNSWPLSWRWCCPTKSSSVTPFPSCPQSFPASGSFPMSWFFASGSQNIGAPVSPSVQWIFRVDFLWDWFIWSPCCPRDSQECSPTSQSRNINYLMLSLLYVQLSHDWWKNHSFDYVDLCWQSLFFLVRSYLKLLSFLATNVDKKIREIHANSFPISICYYTHHY